MTVGETEAVTVNITVMQNILHFLHMLMARTGEQHFSQSPENVEGIAVPQHF